MKPRPELAALIGDLVGSRTSLDRGDLHARLLDALREVNALVPPLRPLWITAGDEFQGTFSTVGAAVQASLLIRVRLAPEHDVRHGIGWGSTSVLDEAGGIEDGPAWWAARAGIEAAERGERSAAGRTLRTAYALADGVQRTGRRDGQRRAGPA